MKNGCRSWPRRSRLGAQDADLCRRHDVSFGLIYTWRRTLLDGGVAQEAGVPEALPTLVFVEAVMDDDPAVAASAAEHPAMIIDLPRGKRLSVFAAASPALVAAALKGLR
jgi:transposase